jgi:hypothetical protein
MQKMLSFGSMAVKDKLQPISTDLLIIGIKMKLCRLEGRLGCTAKGALSRVAG